MSTSVKSCPLCNSYALDVLFTREKSAVLQNCTFVSSAQARSATSGNLRIAQCQECGFIHNNAFDPSLISYTEEYENEQGNSPRFSAHLAELASHVRGGIIDKEPVSIIDIGCGQGGFLKLLSHSLVRLNVKGFGFDTAYRGPPQNGNAMYFYRDYFDTNAARHIPPGDVILLTRHVIEHVPDPVQFLAGIRAAIRDNWRARLFVETPCVEWIFRNYAVQDFFYEHCNYWTAATLSMVASRAGFSVTGIRHVFDEQYLWMEAVPSETSDQSIPSSTIGTLVKHYLQQERETIDAWRNCATSAAAQGPIALWGAGAKGVTMAALIDPECKIINCLIDINPRKQNRYIPVTAHAVVSLEVAHTRGVQTALVMNRNYLPEISEMLRDKNINIRLIDETMISG